MDYFSTYIVLFRRSRSRSRDKRSRSATPERKAPVNAEGAITIKDEPLDKVTAESLLYCEVGEDEAIVDFTVVGFFLVCKMLNN